MSIFEARELPYIAGGSCCPLSEYLAGPFPEMRVVVIDAQPTDRINTVSLPRATYSDAQ
jgi:hypothetical protein